MHWQARVVHIYIQGPTIQLMHIRGPTIQTYEGPQGPGTMLLKSGTVPEIRGPLRPMLSLLSHGGQVGCLKDSVPMIPWRTGGMS